MRQRRLRLLEVMIDRTEQAEQRTDGRVGAFRGVDLDAGAQRVQPAGAGQRQDAITDLLMDLLPLPPLVSILLAPGFEVGGAQAAAAVVGRVSRRGHEQRRQKKEY